MEKLFVLIVEHYYWDGTLSYVDWPVLFTSLESALAAVPANVDMQRSTTAKGFVRYDSETPGRQQYTVVEREVIQS